jgi:hypothetical protein
LQRLVVEIAQQQPQLVFEKRYLVVEIAQFQKLNRSLQHGLEVGYDHDLLR